MNKINMPLTNKLKARALIYWAGTGGNFVRWLMLRDDKNFELGNNEYQCKISEFHYNWNNTHLISTCHNYQVPEANFNSEYRLINLYSESELLMNEAQIIWGLKTISNKNRPHADHLFPADTTEGKIDILRDRWQHHISGNPEPNNPESMKFPESKYNVSLEGLLYKHDPAEMLKLFGYFNIECTNIDENMSLIYDYWKGNQQLLEKYGMK